jgi:hypothetical protein
MADHPRAAIESIGIYYGDGDSNSNNNGDSDGNCHRAATLALAKDCSISCRYKPPA